MTAAGGAEPFGRGAAQDRHPDGHRRDCRRVAGHGLARAAQLSAGGRRHAGAGRSRDRRRRLCVQPRGRRSAHRPVRNGGAGGARNHQPVLCRTHGRHRPDPRSRRPARLPGQYGRDARAPGALHPAHPRTGRRRYHPVRRRGHAGGAAGQPAGRGHRLCADPAPHRRGTLRLRRPRLRGGGLRRPRSSGASRPPADRAGAQHQGDVGGPRPHRRLPGLDGAAGPGRPTSSSPARPREPRRRGRWTGCSSVPIRRPPSSATTTSWRSASWPPWFGAGCGPAPTWA